MTRMLARVFEYLLSFFSQILDLIHSTVSISILIWRDTEHQKFKAGFRVRLNRLTEKGLFVDWTIFENKLNSFRKIIPLKILPSKKLNIVNVSKPSIVNFRVEEISRADRGVNEPGWF